MNDRDYVSIARFAELAGVSKQAIYKQVNNKNSKLFPFTLREGRKMLIKVSALKEVYEVETVVSTDTTQNTTQEPTISTKTNPETVEEPTPKNQPNQQDNQASTTYFQPISTDYIEFLKAQIEELKAERVEVEKRLNATIQEKDGIIKDQSAQLARLAEQVADIASKAIITTSQQQLLSAVDKVEKQETVPAEIIEEDNISTKKRRGLFNFFFR